ERGEDEGRAGGLARAGVRPGRREATPQERARRDRLRARELRKGSRLQAPGSRENEPRGSLRPTHHPFARVAHGDSTAEHISRRRCASVRTAAAFAVRRRGLSSLPWSLEPGARSLSYTSLYPNPYTVRMCVGLSGCFSIFFRSFT